MDDEKERHLEATEICEWSTSDVQYWLEQGYTPMTDEEITILIENEVDGKTLTQLTEDLLIKMDFSDTMAWQLLQTVKRDRDGLKGKKGITTDKKSEKKVKSTAPSYD